MEAVFDESWFHAPIGEVGCTAVLSGEESNHLLKVLRLQPGREIVVTNGEGGVYLCRTDLENGRLLATAVKDFLPARPRPGIHMVLSLLKGKDIEEPVEGLCQLPLAAIHLVLTDHCQAFKGQDHAKLVERLRAKSRAALKQAKKGWLTAIHPPSPLRSWRRSHPGPLVLVHPGSDGIPRHLDGPFYVLVGPEGGFSKQELEWLLGDEKAAILDLGPTRIRGTHAPLLACGKLMGLGLI